MIAPSLMTKYVDKEGFCVHNSHNKSYNLGLFDLALGTKHYINDYSWHVLKVMENCRRVAFKSVKE